MADVPTVKADPSIGEILVDRIIEALSSDRIVAKLLNDRPSAQHLIEAERLAETLRPKIAAVVDDYLDSFEDIRALHDFRLRMHNAFYGEVWNADLNRLNEIKVFLDPTGLVASGDPES
jgi:hypothetical protein